MAVTKKYATGTLVPIARSREEIETVLKKYNAQGFMYGNQGDVAAVLFEMGGRRYRIELRYPSFESFYATKTRIQAQSAYEQEQRRMWRALLLVIKAKLEAVNSGITTIEDEFLASTVMTNNQTVKEWLEPQIDEMYRTGDVPPVMPWLTRTAKPKQLSSGAIIDGEVIPE